MKRRANALDILIVEDSPSDVFLAQEALKQTNQDCHVHVVSDGVEAMEFLRRHGPHANAPRPDLILLDLNMPRKDGREVLMEIKTDENLKSIPVLVLTSSSAEQDINKAYSLHANCYITKPADFARFKAVIRSIQAFWFGDVTLPPHD